MTDPAATTRESILYFGNRIPFLDLIGLKPDELRLDHVTAQLKFHPSLANGAGHLHGGTLMSALDFAMSAAARSSDPAGLMPSTIEMRTSFLRPGETDVEIVARCVHRGRSIAFCEATAYSQTKELVATASGVFKLTRKAGAPDAG